MNKMRMMMMKKRRRKKTIEARAVKNLLRTELIWAGNLQS
jgi:hypothetical protein